MTGTALAVYLAATIAALFALALLLAAATLTLRALTERRIARVARLEADWTPHLLEVLSGDRTPPSLAARIAAGDRVQFADFLLRFVRRLKGPERDLLVALAAPFLEDVASRAHGGTAEDRALAVQMLGTLGPAQHAAAVRAALDDPSPLVAMTAARALARQGNAAHVGAILERLPRFREWSPGFLAAMLAAVGPDAAPALRVLLADAHREPGDRAVAADALRMLHDLPAADAAGDVVRVATDADLLAAALRLLGAVGGAAQAPAVRAACGRPDAVVRAQACAALGAIGGAQDRELLRAALDDASPWVVLHAARSLAKVGGAALLHAAADRPGAGLVRQVAAEPWR
jgi:HEAT repeat protein